MDSTLYLEEAERVLLQAKVLIRTLGDSEVARIKAYSEYVDTVMKAYSEYVDTVYEQWARDNYSPGDDIKPIWHPVVRAECELIDREYVDTVKNVIGVLEC